jgi:nucleolar protein 4
VTQLHGKAITPADVAAAEAAAAVAAEAAAAAAAAGGKASKKAKAKQASKQSAKQLKQQQAAAAAAAAVAAGTEGGVVLWARHVSGEGALVKKWRLILRNMPFQVSSGLLVFGVATWGMRGSESHWLATHGLIRQTPSAACCCSLCC